MAAIESTCSFSYVKIQQEKLHLRQEVLGLALSVPIVLPQTLCVSLNQLCPGEWNALIAVGLG